MCHALGEKQGECELSVAEHITSHLPAFGVTKFVFSLSDNCLSAQREFYTCSADLTGSFVGLCMPDSHKWHIVELILFPLMVASLVISS